MSRESFENLVNLVGTHWKRQSFWDDLGTHGFLFLKIFFRPKTQDLSFTLVKILSFATNHSAIKCGSIITVVCNYFDHVYNYKFGIV